MSLSERHLRVSLVFISICPVVGRFPILHHFNHSGAKPGFCTRVVDLEVVLICWG